MTQAVRHAADCGDWPFAAGIVLDELAIDQLLDQGGNESLADVFRRMPPDLAGTRPEPLLVAAAMELSGAADDPGGPVVTEEAIPDGFPADGDVTARLAAAPIRLALSRRTGDRSSQWPGHSTVVATYSEDSPEAAGPGAEPC